MIHDYKDNEWNLKKSRGISRRSFLKLGTLSFVAIGLGLVAKSVFREDEKAPIESPKPEVSITKFQNQLEYQDHNTKMSIDEYVDNYVSKYLQSIEINGNVEQKLKDNRGLISIYANVNNVPSDLLATIIANEQVRIHSKKNFKDWVWDKSKNHEGLLNFYEMLGVAVPKDPSEGIAQMKISLASYYLNDIIEIKGMDYITDKLSDEIKKDIDLGRLEQLIRKFDDVGQVDTDYVKKTDSVDDKEITTKKALTSTIDSVNDTETGSDDEKEETPPNKTATSIMHNLSKDDKKSEDDRKYLVSSLTSILDESDDISIELAAKHTSYLKERIKSVFELSDDDFISNPVGLMLLFRGYIQSENKINFETRYPRKHKETFDVCASALSFLKSKSKIKNIFSGEKYQIVSDRRIVKKIDDVLNQNTPEYIQITSLFEKAYFEKSHVYRSKYLIEVYDVAINVAANARDDLNRSEYAKIAAFSLYRAKIALDNCGVKYVKYPDYAMIARSTKKMGCKEVTWPKDKEQIYIDQIYKCLEKGYENVLENYRIANQDVDIPVFGNRIIKEIK